MSKNDKMSESNTRQNNQISKLAKDAMTTVRSHLASSSNQRLLDAAKWLTTYTLSPKFDVQEAFDVLLGKGLNKDAIIDHCIPISARHMGEDWVSDTLSFSDVTVGTAHLHMLLNNISLTRKSTTLGADGKCALVVVLGQEQHTLGAMILGDQLRRAGYSLKILLKTTEAEVLKHVKSNSYDAIFFSAGSESAARLSATCVNKIRHSDKNSPLMFLGGSILNHDPTITVPPEFDLACNELDVLIDKIENNLTRT